MQIEAHVTLPYTGARKVTVTETDTPGLWISAARTSRQGNMLMALSGKVHPNGGAFGIEWSDVRITIIGANVAVDVGGCAGG